MEIYIPKFRLKPYELRYPVGYYFSLEEAELAIQGVLEDWNGREIINEDKIMRSDFSIEVYGLGDRDLDFQDFMEKRLQENESFFVGYLERNPGRSS